MLQKPRKKAIATKNLSFFFRCCPRPLLKHNCNLLQHGVLCYNTHAIATYNFPIATEILCYVRPFQKKNWTHMWVRPTRATRLPRVSTKWTHVSFPCLDTCCTSHVCNIFIMQLQHITILLQLKFYVTLELLISKKSGTHM